MIRVEVVDIENSKTIFNRRVRSSHRFKFGMLRGKGLRRYSVFSIRVSNYGDEQFVLVAVFPKKGGR